MCQFHFYVLVETRELTYYVDFISEGNQNPLPVRLLHVKPRMPKNAPKTLEQRMSVKAELNLDPTCSYRIRYVLIICSSLLCIFEVSIKSFE